MFLHFPDRSRMGEGRSPHGAAQHIMLPDDQKSDSGLFGSSHEIHHPRGPGGNAGEASPTRNFDSYQIVISERSDQWGVAKRTMLRERAQTDRQPRRLCLLDRKDRPWYAARAPSPVGPVGPNGRIPGQD